ncbi:MAG: hypothetical protein K8R02_01590 [Anaerohalosphaeraceae bacterium]|nr:hypothetical protein [Anaerohalosphaeraceae bacterium]
MADKSSGVFRLGSLPLLFLVGFAGWWVPGLGHLIIGKKASAAIIFGSILSAIFVGLWISSIAVIDTHEPWYWAQLFNSPLIALLSYLNGEVCHCSVFGRPREIGQIYTGVAGMLNLLCVVNAVYLAHKMHSAKESE